MITQIIFCLFATVAIFSGIMVVASTNPVRGALFLVLTFFSMAGIWLLLHAEFLALILVLVYVGAVMTLFLFVVMMLTVNRLSLKEGFVNFLPLAIVLMALTVILMLVVLGPERFGLSQMAFPPAKPADYSNTASLGMLIYTKYAYPFEVAGVLLLTAIIAAISLTHRHARKKKHQTPARQMAVRKEDRLRILKMPSPKPKGAE